MTPSNLSNRLFILRRSMPLLICCMGMLVHTVCNATILATGDSSTPYTFSVPVSAKTYDPYTGTLYVGLGSVPSTAAYLISSVPRPFGNDTPKFTGIGTNITISAAINYLALLTYPGNLSPLIAFTQPGTYAVSAITNNGSVFNTSANLYDANDTPALVTGDIVALAANRYYAFAAVPPAGLAFGTANSGIAVVCVKATTSNGTISAITLTQTQQTRINGTDPQVRAKRVDPTTPQVFKNNALSSMENSAKLYWDEPLQRLYIGIQGTSAPTGNSGIKSVVVGSLNNTATLTLINIVPDTTIVNTIDTNMIAAATNVPIQKSLAIMNLGVMHCSTGPSYLIINGGNGTSSETSNTIYALPLIDDPTSDSHGTVASIYGYDAAKHLFTTAPTTNANLPTNTQAPVLVGTGPLPITEDSLTVSDMVVVGDTVYVAITGLQGTTHENGVLYSQALFAADGSIARWTAWTKRAFPYRGFCDNTTCVNSACTTSSGCNTGCQADCTSLSVCDIGCQNEGVFQFAVDAVNGKIWAIDGTTKRIVRLTAWDRGGCISQLPCKVSQALHDGCYSVLDLDQYTRGFSDGVVSSPTKPRTTTEHRYALFGGCNKVIFTRVSEAIPLDNAISLTSPQTVITDYSLTPNDCTACTINPQNILISTLPENAGCINQLEYSRQTNGQGTQNYFFAGTNSGLYIFAGTDGSGFNVTTLTTLDAAPFTTGSWHAIGVPFNVPIVAIKTTGNFLYIITRSIQKGHLKCKLYKLSFTDNVSTMVASATVIAETGIAPFAKIFDFSGLQLVTADGTTEQLFLATNKGLFLYDVTTNAWSQSPTSASSMFAGIAGIDTRYPLTVWPFSVEDPSGFHVFDRSSIFQISVPTATPSSLTFVPDDFNANSCNNAFNTFYPITYFWADGARRFFIVNRSCEDLTRNRLMVLPYDVNLWHVTNPAQQIITYDSFVIGAKRFFWVKQIGITGILMAGADRGVIALE